MYKKPLKTLVSVVGAVWCFLPWITSAAPYLQNSSGLVSMETEHFDANVPNSGYQWTLDYTSGYSGNGAMKAPSAAFKTGYVQNSARLDYYVDFAFSGTHYLWVRAYATSSSTNSLHAGLDGGTAAGGADIQFAYSGKYVWATTTLNIPSVGLHTVNLWVRESFAVVDKVVLTTDAGYVPGGFGPPENIRGFLCLDTPSIAILFPENDHLQTSQDLAIITQTCLDDVLHAGWGVKFEIDGGIINGGRESYVYTPPYETTFLGLALEEHTIDVSIVDAEGVIVPGANNHAYVDRVGIGDYYIAIGDSIMTGHGDDNPSDNVSRDGRNSGGGFLPILNDLLSDPSSGGYPHTFISEAVSGSTSTDGLLDLPAILQRHPDAQRVLSMYGMNDARPWLPKPSGLGLWPGNSGYVGTFKDNMQRMLDLIRNNAKETLLAKTIIALGDSATGPTYLDPNQSARSQLIQEYNQVVDELFEANMDIIFIPPDFYSYFEIHYPDQYFDNIHPNGAGYRSMADIWFDVLTLPEYRRQ